ncbi:MAG: Nif3-like dinuclear metal center hexameric protein, partial [Deltaproteobacteria bacterium]|nr:Nif3-like dinuclear metal center hexameric protein [Deltaproteobacteria bacterium]
MITVEELSKSLDVLFEIWRFDDYTFNGLQVTSNFKKPVKRVGLAVDLTEEVLEQSIQQSLDFIILHHGLIFEPVRRLTPPLSRFFCDLLRHEVSVYVAHLPMDAHQEFGHSRVIGEQIGLADLNPFPSEKNPFGVCG